MSNLPTVKAKEFIQIITKLGYQLKNSLGRRVTVPIHSGKD